MTSPTIKTMSFSEAMIKVREDKKITRVEWANNQFYGVFKNTVLMLHKPDGKFYNWIINEGDLLGEDWIIVHNN